MVTNCTSFSAVYSIPLRHALFANDSISSVTIGPLTVLSSIASTTALATTSACSGFSTAAPAIDDRRPPIAQLSVLNGSVAYAKGTVKNLEESYKKPGRMKMLRSLGNEDAMVVSASLFVLIYRAGRIGAPPAAEM